MEKYYKKNQSFDPKAPHNNRSLKNLKGEEWKDIPEKDGLYLISNYGRVKSMPRYLEVYASNTKEALSIMRKDQNGLNNYYKNLAAGHRNAVMKRAYDKKDISVLSH